jgi:hypothetical protein
MTARILPASLKVNDDISSGHHPGVPKGAKEMVLSFRIHWLINCSEGAGGCSGELDLHAPGTRSYHTAWYWSDSESQMRGELC